jgi:chaperone required for assembly of F1-ATPase
MRDLFDDIFQNQPLDPTEAARRSMRGPLRKRFYKAAGTAEQDGSHAVLLDGRAVRTPARRTLVAPTRALAQALAEEWESQREVIDPAAMPLTRLANSIIDGVVEMPEPVQAEVAKYLGSDLVFYRAPGPPGLVARQMQHWDPVLAFARDELGARFILSEGIAFVSQPPEALATASAAIPSEPWPLGAVNVITGLTGSALIALMLERGRISPDEAWAAAHVDEDWNMAQWGQDEQELQRRARREVEMRAAAKALQLL